MGRNSHRHLGRNNTIMHKIDNIEDFQKDTIDIYKPKKSMEVSTDNLFDDSFSVDTSEKDDSTTLDITPIIIGVIAVIISIGVFIALKHFNII